MSEPNYFMVRALQNTETYLRNFTENGIVAIGWSDVDFTAYAKPEEIFRDLSYLKQVSPQTAGRHQNEILRFLRMKNNDRIIVPYGDCIVLAIATGEKRYNKKCYDLDQANEASVTYLLTEDRKLLYIPRDSLSEALQRRLRVRGMTISDLNEFRGELDRFFEKGISEKVAYSWNAGVEEYKNAQDALFRTKLLQSIREGNTNLKTGGIGLERLVQALAEIEGYDSSVLGKATFPSFADADVIATKVDRFSSETHILFQVKHHSGTSDSYGIDQLLEIKKCLPDQYKSHILVFVTSADVDSVVRAKSEMNDVQIIDGAGLVDWIMDAFDELSPEIKRSLGIIEIPQVIDPACR